MENAKTVTIVIDHRVVHKKNYKRMSKSGHYYDDPKVRAFETLLRNEAIQQLKLKGDRMPLFGDRELGMRIIASYRDKRWLHDVSNIADCISDAFQDRKRHRTVVAKGALYHDDKQITALEVERKADTGVDQIVISVWPIEGGEDV
jgi:Holliday junction resolvase RusA-like endonuclease